MPDPDWQQIMAVAWPLFAALLFGLVLRRVLLAAARRARAREDRLYARVVRVIAVPAAVALPHSTTTARADSARAAATRMPSERATSSPRASVLSERADRSARTTPTMRKGPIWAMTSLSRPASEPTIQKRNWSSVCTSSSSTVEVSALSRAESAAPASASLARPSWSTTDRPTIRRPW